MMLVDLFQNSVFRMTSELAKLTISGITNTTDGSEKQKEPPECLLNLLQYNPLSLACASIYYKYKTQQNKNYTYEDLYTDIDQTVKQLQAIDQEANKLQIIQITVASLATKELGECSPELLHVFDFLGSCSVNNPIPVFLFAHHLKTSEYHVQMKPEGTEEQAVPSEDTNLSVNAALKQEHDLWSFRGIVDRAIKVYERVKLEVNALRGLFGYGDTALGAESKSASDGLEVIRSCPLFVISHEPMAGRSKF